MSEVRRLMTLSMAAFLLSGCTLLKVVFFREDLQSNKREGSVVTLDVQSVTDCTAAKIEMLPPAIIAALGGVAVNILASEIEGYLDSKKKEFTASYSVTKNIDYYYKRRGQKDYVPTELGCLIMTRWIPSSQPPGADGKQKMEKAFEWRAKFVPNDSGAAVRIETEHLSLASAAARTSESSGKVDLTVEIKIDVTTSNEKKQIVTNTLADKVLSYHGVKISAGEVKPKIISSWFPAVPLSEIEIAKCEALNTQKAGSCGGVSPISVSVLVSEVGSGGDDFGNLGKEIDDNKKALGDAVSKTISDALTEKASGGKSK